MTRVPVHGEEDEILERRRHLYGGPTPVAIVVSLVGVAIAFLVQFGGSVWWGASLSSDVRHAISTLQRIEDNSYTKAEATRDIQRLDQQDAQIVTQLNEVRARLTRLEDKLDGTTGNGTRKP